MTDDIVAIAKEFMVVGTSLTSGANNVRQHCLPYAGLPLAADVYGAVVIVLALGSLLAMLRSG